MKRSTKAPPTDEEIMGYSNVPVEVAGRYIGWGHTAVRYALQQGRAPFGIAAQGENVWYYNISPGALVRYKREGVPALGLGAILELVAKGVTKILDLRMEAAKQALNKAMDGSAA